jgi:hypothetical protein
MAKDDSKPWYFEDPTPRLFNEWSLVHLATGFIYGQIRPNDYLGALLVHTAYEVVEGQIFPVAMRDTSMRNHIGDTVAMAGNWFANRGKSKP